MLNRLLGQYRRYLTNYESALAYALLGVVGGVASGLVVIAFEASIRQLALLWGVGDGGDAFEALPQWLLFTLPAGGGVLLGLAFWALRPEDREVGIRRIDEQDQGERHCSRP